jgi:WD40 repeat protein
VTSGSQDRTVKLWDVATGVAIRTFVGHSNTITSIEFSSDGKSILSGSYDTTFRLWDAAAGTLLRTFDRPGGGVVLSAALSTSVAFSPDGMRVLSGSEDMTRKLWDGYEWFTHPQLRWGT